MTLLSALTVVLTLFYTGAYVRANGMSLIRFLGVLIGICAGAAFLAAMTGIKKLRLPRWSFLVLFGLSVFCIENISLAWYASAYLIEHVVVVQLLTLWYVLKIVGFYFFFSFIVFQTGDAFLSHFASLKEIPAYVSCAIAVGLLVMALYVYAAALLGIVYLIVFAPLLIIACCNRRGLKKVYARGRRAWSFLTERVPVCSAETLFYTTLAVLGAFYIINNAWPIVLENDSLAQYFDLPNTIIRQHQLVRYPYWTFNDAVIAYSFIYVPILYAGQIIFNSASLYFFLLGLPALFALHQTLTGRTDYLVLWLYSTVPMFISWLVLTPKIDHLVIFFVIIAALLVLQLHRTQAPTIAFLAGIMVAFAIASKFNTALSVLIWGGLGAGVMVFSRISIRKITRLAAIFCLSAALMFGLFAVRMQYYHGNFLYPFSGVKNYRIHSSVTYGPSDEAYLDLLSRGNDALNATIGYSNSLIENIFNFFAAGLTHASFNYGALLMLLVVGFFFCSRMPLLLRATTLSLGAVFIAWYVLIRTEMHYIDFSVPFFAVIGAWVLARSHRIARGVVIALISVIAILNMAFSSFAPATAIAGASDVAVFKKFPSYAFEDIARSIIRQNPQALFISEVDTVIVIPDAFKHRFANVRNYYLAAVLHRSQTPQEALRYLKADGITHLIYSDQVESKYLRKCHEHGSDCPLLQDFFLKMRTLLTILRPVAEAEPMVIYEL